MTESDLDKFAGRVNQIQSDIGAWGKRNFPDAKPYMPLLGVSEEVGELCHAHLKLDQGIRGDTKKHLAAKIDAVGDVFVFLAHYCELNGILMGDAIAKTWMDVRKRDWQKDPTNGGQVE